MAATASLTTGNAEQYRDSDKLAARARLNTKYTVDGEPWLPWVARKLAIRQGDRLLDVGCGPGWIWPVAAPTLPAGIELLLTDLSPGMVAEAEARCADLPFAAVRGLEADAAALPFADASVDGVLAMHMLYHLPDPALAIAEMHRVLRPGGFAAVTTNGVGNMRRLYALAAAIGASPFDPAAAAFGFAQAENMLAAQFGRVDVYLNPARMRITSAEDVFLAFTSYPPGDRADDEQLAAFRRAIDDAFAADGGALHVDKEAGLFIAIKSDAQPLSGGLGASTTGDV